MLQEIAVWLDFLHYIYCFSISVPNVIPEWFNATVIAPYNKKGEGSYVVKIELYESTQGNRY